MNNRKRKRNHQHALSLVFRMCLEEWLLTLVVTTKLITLSVKCSPLNCITCLYPPNKEVIWTFTLHLGAFLKTYLTQGSLFRMFPFIAIKNRVSRYTKCAIL